MSELPKKFIKDKLRRSLEDYNKKFRIDEKDGWQGDIPESVNDMEAIATNLIKLVRTELRTVDWRNESEINKFCQKLDKLLIDIINPRFLKAFSRVKDAEPQKKLEAFLFWLNNLRKSTRAEIQDLLKKQPSLSENNPENKENGTGKKEVDDTIENPEPIKFSLFDDLLLQADLAGDLMELLSNLSEAIILNDRKKINEALVDFCAFEKATQRSQEADLWGEVEADYQGKISQLEESLKDTTSQKNQLAQQLETIANELEAKQAHILILQGRDSELKTVEARLTMAQEESENQKSINMELLQQIENLKHQRQDLAERITILDLALKATERNHTHLQRELRDISTQEEKLLVTIETATNFQVSSHFSSLSQTARNALSVYIQAFQVDQKAIASAAVDRFLKDLLEIDTKRQNAEEKNNALTDKINILQAGLDRAEQILGQNESQIETLERGRRALMTLTERLAVENEELRNGLQDMKPIEKPKETPSLVLTEKSKIQAELAVLRSQKEALENHSRERAEWIEETEANLKGYIRKKVALAEEIDVQTINALEEKYRAYIDKVKQEHNSIETQLTEIMKSMSKLENYLRAIELLEKGLGDKKNPATDFTDLTELPSFERLVKNLESPENIPTNYDKLSDSEHISIEGLPYTVEFTSEALQVVRELEAELVQFKEMPYQEIVQILPLSRNYSGKKEVYDDLIQDLKNGVFLEDLKKAFTILGAMRKGNGFESRRSQTVGIAMKLKNVKLIEQLGEESKSVTGALAKIYLLGAINDRYKLLNRENAKGPDCIKNRLLPLGEMASQIWTKDLLEQKFISREQLAAIHATTQEQDQKLKKI